MKPTLTQTDLIRMAKRFCTEPHVYRELFGVTDGKAVGTFIEHKFRDRLDAQYAVLLGSSALGIDLPGLETDIKVTSIRQPQSSSPFRSARQKVFGLGYHLLLFVYEKSDHQRRKSAMLNFVSCSFIDKSRTADHQTTRGILDILQRDGNHDDIVACLYDRQLPGDDATFNALADEILKLPPLLGYLAGSIVRSAPPLDSYIATLSHSATGLTRIL